MLKPLYKLILYYVNVYVCVCVLLLYCAEHIFDNKLVSSTIHNSICHRIINIKQNSISINNLHD